LGQFLALLRDGTIKPGTFALAVESFSRFNRQMPTETVALMVEIVKAGCALVFDRPRCWIETIEDLNGTYWRDVSQEVEIAWRHSKRLSEDLSESWERKRSRKDGLTKKKVKSAACPSWITVKDNQYILNDKAETLKTIRHMMLTDKLGVGQVQSELGIKWPGLGNILRSRTLLGEYQPMKRLGKNKREPIGEPIPGYYPFVFTEHEFITLQNLLDSRKNNVGRKGTNGEDSNLFTHILYDGSDGSPMHMVQQSNGKRVLISKNHKGHKLVHYPFVEGSLLALLSEVKPAHLRPTVPDVDTVLAEYEVKLGKINTRITEIEKDMLFSDSDYQRLSSVHKTATEHRDTLKSQINQHKAAQAKPTQDEVVKGMFPVLGMVRSGKTEYRTRLKGILRTLVSRIECRVSTSTEAEFTVELADGSVKGPVRFKQGTDLAGVAELLRLPADTDEDMDEDVA